METYSSLNESDKFIYEKNLSRVSDLNRVIFNYRLVYVTVVAGYFTSLSFVSGISSRSGFLNYPEAYALLLMLLTTAGFVAVVILLFFDFIHQELVENAVSAAEVIERTNAHFFNRRALARPSSGVTSLYINTAIFLFYLVPGAFLFGFAIYIANLVHTDTPFDGFSDRVSSLCEYTIETDPETGQAVDRIYDADCMDFLANYSYVPEFRDVIFRAFALASFFAGVSVIVAVHRIFGRVLSCFFAQKYSPLPVHINQIEFSPRIKRNFDKLANLVLILFVSIGLCGLVALVFSDGLVHHLQGMVFAQP